MSRGVWIGAGVIVATFVAAPGGCAQRRGIRPPTITSPSLEARRQAQELAAQAQAAAAKGHTDEAIDLYTQALSHDRDLAHVWNNLGVLYRSRREYPKAIEAFNRAAALWPTDPRPVTNIGQVWLDLGYARDALKHFEEALGREPDNLPALRGAIMSAHLLNIADAQTAEWIRLAMLLENDPEWATYLREQRARVAGRLDTDLHAPRVR